MACFLVPAAEAIITTAVAARVAKAEEAMAPPAALGAPAGAPTGVSPGGAAIGVHSPGTPAPGAVEGAAPMPMGGRIPWKRKLSWLNGMLWGGSILLLLEHIRHGEVVLYPPFLTAMHSPADTAAMLREMATTGVGMAVLVTAVWGVMALAADRVPRIKAALAGGEL
jgi:hypothetical protein